MFELLFLFSSFISCDGPIAQQLVFGVTHQKDGTPSHYCDVLLTPSATITSVTVFLKTGGDDSAVPKCMIQPKASPSSRGFTRLEIPETLSKDGIYNFQLTCSNGQVLNTETWAWDPKAKQFSHSSAIRKPFYTSKAFIIIFASCSVVVLFALSYMIYRIFRKNKAAL